MLAKTKFLLLRIGGLALALAALVGYRCPAQGCPCCKIVGK